MSQSWFGCWKSQLLLYEKVMSLWQQLQAALVFWQCSADERDVVRMTDARHSNGIDATVIADRIPAAE